MNLKTRVRKFIRTKIFDPMENIDLQNVVGWHSIGGSSVYNYYKDQQYENGYSSITKLANGFAACEPYTIDKNSKSVASNVLDRLYTPNADMSAYDFREALAVTSLVHDKVLLRVHHRGNSTRFNADAILGFTFMEGYSESIIDGARLYKLPNGDTLTDSEVVTLKSINPDNLSNGFSASRAARRWTRLDDYIADYQRGFFENGAVPSGEMIITARTKSEFNDIVDTLQAKHRGAGKNNNITYTHRPTDQDGKPMNSQIEWVPFSSPNKDMALKDLFDNVNKKIDSVYGVPEEIRGHLSNSNYASVAVAEKVFVKYALDPLTMKVWSKFTHELNRITGGTGVAITYDLEIPKIADEEKIKAEAKSVDAGTVGTLVNAGFTLESAIEYVETGELNALVKSNIDTEEKPEVLSAEDAKGTPSQPLDIYAKSFEKDLAEIKAMLIHRPTPKALEPKPSLAPKRIGEVDLVLYVEHMKKIIKRQMNRQLDRALAKLDEAIKSKAYGDTTEEEDKLFTKEMLALLIPLATVYGNKTVNTGINLIVQAGLSTQDITPFEFTPAQKKAYEKYLAKVGTGYADQTAEEIRKILGEGILNGATKQEIESQLRRELLAGPNDYRVERLAKTEVNLTEGRASVSAMENISEQTGYQISKIWNTSGDEPCEFCQALDGTVISVQENFVDKGAEIEGIEGGIYHNDFTATDTADAHPNCNCYTTYMVERG
jgi:phage portal protein BeeE